MLPFKVALLQMAPEGADQEANRSKGDAFCRLAHAMGADVALFPEMWNIGYSPDDPRLGGAWQGHAVGLEDGYVQHFRHLARELDMAIAITYLEKWPGLPRNSVSLFDRHGEHLWTYAKVHTCDFAFERGCTPGEGFTVGTLDTAAGEVRVGAMICYDREFPESARLLMLEGAEVILTPNACDLEQHRLSQFRARAYENMVALAMANYAAPKCNGHSIAVDGVCFDERGHSLDTLVVEAGEGEGVYLATFDLEALRAYRRREPWGDAYRHPRHYGSLTAAEVSPPFRRQDARR